MDVMTLDVMTNPQADREAQRVQANREDLARELGMSVSGLHHHFKAVTAMSPLQYQKRLRLLESRRLLLSEDLDATRTAYRVGYQDISHFNREYKSLFGVPPHARRAPAAGSGHGKRRSMSKTSTALQAHEQFCSPGT